MENQSKESEVRIMSKEEKELIGELTRDKSKYVNVKNLVDRFVRTDMKFNHQPWTLAQILSNISIMCTIDEDDIPRQIWLDEHPAIDRIKFLDVYGNEMSDIFSDETYCTNERVIVPDEEALATLKEFTDFTGYCEYYKIKEVGEWVFSKSFGHFVKVD